MTYIDPRMVLDIKVALKENARQSERIANALEQIAEYLKPEEPKQRKPSVLDDTENWFGIR